MLTRPTQGQPIPRLLERLLAAGRITQDDVESTLLTMRRSNAELEEALFDVLQLPETDFLKLLATHYRTRYVSTERLSRADIDASLLQMLSRKVAERHNVFPVVLDAGNATLSVVIADPDNVQVLEEVKVVCRVRDVRAFVARPLAIKAAVAKYYGRDARAFAQLESANAPWSNMVDPFERRAQTGSMPRPNEIFLESKTLGSTSEYPSLAALPLAAAPPAPPSTTLVQGAPPPSLTLEMPANTLVEARPPPMSATSDGPKQPGKSDPAPFHPTLASAHSDAPPSSTRGLTPASSTERPTGAGSIPTESWLETLNVLISLMENVRPDLRGHSAHVARLMRRLCERLGLSAKDVEPIVAAGYLHDLGKASSYHLTPLNVAEYEGHRLGAKKAATTPSRMMESARLPDVTLRATVHMYERFDGKGFPDGLAGKEIPLGARVLAIADTWADLTQNPRNPYRKTLRPKEAGEVLVKFKGTLFDPGLVDVFRQVVLGDDLKAKLLANRRLAVLVDPDPEETTVLELRMIEQGFEVRIARTADAALKLLGECEPDLVVSEVTLEPFDGFELLTKARAAGKTGAWVYLTSYGERDGANRGFELGALDYVNKPVRAEVFVTRLKKIAEQGSGAARKVARGVSGSLEEMSLPDMVQILAGGRKTGALRISGVETAEIHFVGGDIFDAIHGTLRGEHAFYSLVGLKTGEFALDPDFKAERRLMQMSAEGLLLEAMRRMDEAGR